MIRTEKSVPTMIVQWPPLPYESIGKITVVISAVLLALLVIVTVFTLLYVVWQRLLTVLINVMWRGYDIHGEHPPRWRREIAIYLHAIKYRDFSTIQRKRKELQRRENRDGNTDTNTD